MTDIKQLETDLWSAADELRANSKRTAAEYKDPVLGLVFLRFSYNRYLEALDKIEPNLITPRGRREPNKDDFRSVGAILLPEKAQFQYLAELPEAQDLGAAINNAMRLIEEEYPDLEGVLPKDYQLFENSLLRELIRIFNRESLQNAKGDLFGRIYEYFLMQFSMIGAGAQEGGEFFTPPSLVQLLVNTIEPDHGIVLDPACGSGGMFVQTGKFINEHGNPNINAAITCYGTELKDNNARLAKMNLAVHGIEGHILQSNTFYEDAHDLRGKCDFILANPPFNVDRVDKGRDFVQEDPRLPFGLPRNDNANYLWIQYFYSYLNERGRAGFVMASSAADAGHSERELRQKLIESGAVDIIISIGNNFFYTRSLPCHLWFLDKNKHPDNEDYVLMIDARNTFRKVNRTLNDFSPDHLHRFETTVKLYRQEEVNMGNSEWLKEHFPDSAYQNIEGFCKKVSRAKLEENDWSLNPGRYVGVSLEVEEDYDFQSKLSEINSQLIKLNEESINLSNNITSNINEFLK